MEIGKKELYLTTFTYVCYDADLPKDYIFYRTDKPRRYRHITYEILKIHVRSITVLKFIS